MMGPDVGRRPTILTDMKRSTDLSLLDGHDKDPTEKDHNSSQKMTMMLQSKMDRPNVPFMRPKKPSTYGEMVEEWRLKYQSEHVVEVDDAWTPLRSDYIPGPFDVICARGNYARNYTGNRRFRLTVDMNLARYKSADTKFEKSVVVWEVVDSVRSVSPNGGFIKFANTQWYEVGDHVAREKVGQSFRDRLHREYRSSSRSKAAKRKQVQDATQVGPEAKTSSELREATEKDAPAAVASIAPEGRCAQSWQPGKQASSSMGTGQFLEKASVMNNATRSAAVSQITKPPAKPTVNAKGVGSAAPIPNQNMAGVHDEATSQIPFATKAGDAQVVMAPWDVPFGRNIQTTHSKLTTLRSHRGRSASLPPSRGGKAKMALQPQEHMYLDSQEWVPNGANANLSGAGLHGTPATCLDPLQPAMFRSEDQIAENENDTFGHNCDISIHSEPARGTRFHADDFIDLANAPIGDIEVPKGHTISTSSDILLHTLAPSTPALEWLTAMNEHFQTSHEEQMDVDGDDDGGEYSNSNAGANVAGAEDLQDEESIGEHAGV